MIIILNHGSIPGGVGMFCNFLVGDATLYWHAVRDLPANLTEAQIKADLLAREAALLAAAQVSGVEVDIFDPDPRFTVKLMIALALAVLDEINTIRAILRASGATAPDRTLAQLKTIIRNKLGTL